MGPVSFRQGVPADATCIGLLATQVFLDTYATDGVRPDLAREALAEYSPDRFEARLSNPDRLFLLAERGEGLLGFAEICTRPGPLPVPSGRGDGLELVRLYIQPKAQRLGIGKQLLREFEAVCLQAGGAIPWLTVWSGNLRARAFYLALDYTDVGSTMYAFEGNSYENRILAKR